MPAVHDEVSHCVVWVSTVSIVERIGDTAQRLRDCRSASALSPRGRIRSVRSQQW